MDGVLVLGGVDDGATFKVAPGNIQKTVTKPFVKFNPHAFVTVLAVPALPCPRQALVHRNIDKLTAAQLEPGEGLG